MDTMPMVSRQDGEHHEASGLTHGILFVVVVVVMGIVPGIPNCGRQGTWGQP